MTTFGAYEAHGCPACDAVVHYWPMLSATYAGERVWSDAFTWTDWVPLWPVVTKCRNCGTIFWLDEDKSLGWYFPGDQEESERRISAGQMQRHRRRDCTDGLHDAAVSFTAPRAWRRSPAAAWLTVPDLIAALELPPNERWRERHLRCHLHWAPNHAGRGIDIPLCRIGAPVPEAEYRANAARLLELLDAADPGEAVLRIDLLRTLGRFEAAAKVLAELPREMSWIRPQLDPLVAARSTACIELTA